uniref:Uncharacterized protein n=1 Tax=Quercus lobata TaxID=97700 RepID=A0A7N2L013_QUELO
MIFNSNDLDDLISICSMVFQEAHAFGPDDVIVPAHCEWKIWAGNICAASFDRKCNGICKSVERIMDVHQRCGEDENIIWSASF